MSHTLTLGAEHERVPVRQILPPILPQHAAQMVVSLASEPLEAETLDSPLLPEIDCRAALQLIRNAGARMRDTRKAARESAERSQALVQRTLRQADLAKRRVRAAEAAAEAALLRVKRAEAAAQVAEARAHRAEEQM